VKISTLWGEGWGSGTIFDEEGYILTNQHVVKDVNYATISAGSGYVIFVGEAGKDTWQAVVVGRDPTHDLAVLKMVSSLGGEGLPQLSEDTIRIVESETWHAPPSAEAPPLFGDSSSVRKGEEVGTLGFPAGALEHEATFTKGVLSAATPTILQLDAAINPGNSGGPMFNIKGEILGVNFAKAVSWYGPPKEGLGFAVAINVAKENLERLKSGSFGTGRPEMGVYISGQVQLTADQQRQLETPPQRYGLGVSRVMPGYGADEAGLQGGDVIVLVNGQAVQTFDEIRGLVDRLAVGSELRVDYFRGDKLQHAWLILLEKVG